MAYVVTKNADGPHLVMAGPREMPLPTQRVSLSRRRALNPCGSIGAKESDSAAELFNGSSPETRAGGLSARKRRTNDKIWHRIAPYESSMKIGLRQNGLLCLAPPGHVDFISSFYGGAWK